MHDDMLCYEIWGKKTNLPAIFLDVCYADNYFMKLPLRKRVGLFCLGFFCLLISSALTCGIASFFLFIFLVTVQVTWQWRGRARHRRLRLVTRLSTLSLHSCPLVSSPRLPRLISLQTSSLGGIETPRITLIDILLFPQVCFVYVCVKTMKKKNTHILRLPCPSFVS